MGLRGKCGRSRGEEVLQSVQVHRPKEPGRQADLRVASVQGRRQLRRREQQQRLWLRWRRLLRQNREIWTSEEGLLQEVRLSRSQGQVLNSNRHHQNLVIF